MEMDERPGESWTGFTVKEAAAVVADDGIVMDNTTLPESPLLDSVNVELALPPAPKLAGVRADGVRRKSARTVTGTVVV